MQRETANRANSTPTAIKPAAARPLVRRLTTASPKATTDTTSANTNPMQPPAKELVSGTGRRYCQPERVQSAAKRGAFMPQRVNRRQFVKTSAASLAGAVG